MLALAVGIEPASANTPSNYSVHFGINASAGWTNNHAWVIADYADVMVYGAGFIAGKACEYVGGGAGLICEQMVEKVVRQLVAGSARLTNHGLWVSYYLWPSPYTTSGRW